MRIVLAISHFLTGIISVIGGLITIFNNDIANKLFSDIPLGLKWVIISTILVLGLVLLAAGVYDTYLTVKGNRQRHILKYHSRKFMGFFKKWYSKPGELYIMCDDINWVKTEDNIRVFEQLEKKCSRGELNLFLLDRSSPTAKALRRAGAKIYEAPKTLVNNYSFSFIKIMGNYTDLIVRRKEKDNNGFVIFEETQNTYIVGLLKELLPNCKISIDYENGEHNGQK